MKYLVLILFLVILGFAQTAKAGFYGYDPINYFPDENKKTQKDTVVKEKTSKPAEEITPGKAKEAGDEKELWGETTVGEDGKMVTHVPPKPVRDFVENPNEKTVEAYWVWSTERWNKIQKANKTLADYAKKKETPNSGIKERKIKGVDFGIRKNYMVYFFLRGCPVCEKESAVIADIYRNHPEITIETYGRHFSDEELRKFAFPSKKDIGVSAAFGINQFPTMMVFTKTGGQYLIFGYKSENELLRLFS